MEKQHGLHCIVSHHIVSSSFHCVFVVKVLSTVAMVFFLRMSNWKITTNIITQHTHSFNISRCTTCISLYFMQTPSLAYFHFTTKAMLHNICIVCKNTVCKNTVFDRTQRKMGKAFTRNVPWKLNNKLQTNTNDANSEKSRTHTFVHNISLVNLTILSHAFVYLHLWSGKKFGVQRARMKSWIKCIHTMCVRSSSGNNWNQHRIYLNFGLTTTK